VERDADAGTWRGGIVAEQRLGELTWRQGHKGMGRRHRVRDAVEGDGVQM
jgi:hypothetical protein